MNRRRTTAGGQCQSFCGALSDRQFPIARASCMGAGKIVLLLALFIFGTAPLLAADLPCAVVPYIDSLLDENAQPLESCEGARIFFADNGRCYQVWTVPEITEYLNNRGITDEQIALYDSGRCG